ncbi:MAG: DUF3817 domain-containing protein, partial [Acidimicrobiales bacterium]
AGQPAVANGVGTLHGVLYVVYLHAAFRLTRRLGVPKWQMALVLLAGTVPFCAFIAERMMTRCFDSIESSSTSDPQARRSVRSYAASIRKRWLCRRALLLHFEVVVVASGCGLAGWWQATRALAGNQLSWVYSVEWPIFGLLAIVGWWQLVHEPESAYRARKVRQPKSADGPRPDDAGSVGRLTTSGAVADRIVDASTARRATRLAVLVGFESLVGIMAAVAIPFSRPSGWLPSKGEAIYVSHVIVGFVLIVGAAALLRDVRGSSRTSRAIGWMGLIGVLLAGAGGLLTESGSILRFLGMAVMFVGAISAGGSYLIPVLVRARGVDCDLGGMVTRSAKRADSGATREPC